MKKQSMGYKLGTSSIKAKSYSFSDHRKEFKLQGLGNMH